MSFSGTSAETSINGKYPYYLSVSRVPMNSFRSGGEVTIVLDAGEINKKYRTIPVNYYDFISRLERNEAEDRILSNYNKLPIKYVKEYHVFYKPSRDDDPMYKKRFIKTSVFGYMDTTKLFFYDDRKAYDILNKKRSMPYSEFIKKYDINPEYNSNNRWGDELASMVEFLMDGGKNPKTEDLKLFRRNYLGGTYYKKEFISHVSNIIHNAHRRKSDPHTQGELKHLSRYMNQEFGKISVDQFLSQWFDKYVN